MAPWLLVLSAELTSVRILHGVAVAIMSDERLHPVELMPAHVRAEHTSRLDAGRPSEIALEVRTGRHIGREAGPGEVLVGNDGPVRAGFVVKEMAWVVVRGPVLAHGVHAGGCVSGVLELLPQWGAGVLLDGRIEFDGVVGRAQAGPEGAGVGRGVETEGMVVKELEEGCGGASGAGGALKGGAGERKAAVELRAGDGIEKDCDDVHLFE